MLIGNFHIPISVIEKTPELVKAVFRELDCIIIRAESTYYNMQIHYQAICDKFRPIKMEPVPWYNLIVVETENHEFVSLDVKEIKKDEINYFRILSVESNQETPYSTMEEDLSKA
jgi:hypothetical protein